MSRSERREVRVRWRTPKRGCSRSASHELTRVKASRLVKAFLEGFHHSKAVGFKFISHVFPLSHPTHFICIIRS